MGIRREEEMEMSDDDMEDVSESKDSEDSGTAAHKKKNTSHSGREGGGGRARRHCNAVPNRAWPARLVRYRDRKPSPSSDPAKVPGSFLNKASLAKQISL